MTLDLSFRGEVLLTCLQRRMLGTFGTQGRSVTSRTLERHVVRGGFSPRSHQLPIEPLLRQTEKEHRGAPTTLGPHVLATNQLFATIRPLAGHFQGVRSGTHTSVPCETKGWSCGSRLWRGAVARSGGQNGLDSSGRHESGAKVSDEMCNNRGQHASGPNADSAE
jgi:hypothetical protein